MFLYVSLENLAVLCWLSFVPKHNIWGCAFLDAPVQLGVIPDGYLRPTRAIPHPILHYLIPPVRQQDSATRNLEQGQRGPNAFDDQECLCSKSKCVTHL